VPMRIFSPGFLLSTSMLILLLKIEVLAIP
jgi:hypothetical protein